MAHMTEPQTVHLTDSHWDHLKEHPTDLTTEHLREYHSDAMTARLTVAQ